MSLSHLKAHPKSQLKMHSLRSWLIGGLAVLAIACSGSSGGDDLNGPGEPSDPKPGDTDYFESDNPALGSGDSGSDDSSGGGAGGASNGTGAAAPGAEADDGSSDGAERAIEEADIIQVQGDNLYALSRYGGLSVIDVSTRDQLAVTGRYKSDATPFEMYVRGDMIFGLFTTWGHYVRIEGENGARDDWQWVQTSRVVALDVSSPENIRVVGEFELPGDISDSRIVGDVLYVVAYENGYCWRCDGGAQTTVISIDVSKPEEFNQVDRLTFKDTDDTWGWSKRSITVNTERMYVAGREYSDDGRGGSTIQVVDISDPVGDMKLGASVEADGEIRSRWQMSEHEGVLRVISQPPGWNLDAAPVVQTFTVSSSNSVTPLGSMDMVLPRAEQLQSVRFDGDRAYAITFERTDPLFTIDLSNPATPVQRGELEIPGWVYHMEPRGDRILALGFDNNNAAGSLNVSIFNVEDMDNPTMLDRVNFGGDWSSVGEDQDRIHKAFKILDDQGLILMPYSGWNYDDGSEDGYCGGRYVSGVQLIDFTRDDLDLRGIAESYGRARRAFIHDERLFTVSDDRVQTFEMSDRDAPAKTAAVPLARFVSATAATDDQLLRMGQDWWTDSAQLDVVSIDDANSVSATGSIDLTSALEQDRCTSSLSGARVFGDGDRAYIVYNEWDYNEGGHSLGVAAVDITDPANPTLLSNTDLGFSAGYYWGGYGYDSVATSGQRSVQIGSTLVFTRFDREWIDQSYVVTDAHLQIADLSDPANPVVHRININNTDGLTGLHLDGTDVLLSHFEPVPNQPGRVRFFVDRIDLSNPNAPRYVGKVNVPGSLFAYDAKNDRAVTVDYRRYREEMTREDCYQNHGGYVSWLSEDGEEPWEYGYDPTDVGQCEWVRHTFRLVKLGRTSAALEGSHELGDGAYLGQVAVGDGHAFVAINNYYGGYYYDCLGCMGYDSERRSMPLLVLSGLDDGNFVVAQANIENDTPWGGYVRGLGAYGSRALLSTGYNGELVVLNAENRNAPVVERTIDVAGYVREITIANGVGVVSLGYDGVEMVDLR